MSVRPKLPANPPFCAGPFSRYKDSGWINGVDAFGGACHMLDMRGWGYLTGQGQALALPADEAIDAQNATAQWVVDALNAAWERDQGLITPSQHDAPAAHVAAEVAKARAEDAAKLAFPADVLEFALKIGRAEWGQTDPKTAAEHAADMASTVEKTAAHFGQTEPQSLNGLYIEGTGIVICHTGVSPNSPEIARILTGLWNMIYDVAQIGAKP